MAKFWAYYDRITRPFIPAFLGFVAGAVFAMYVLGEALARGMADALAAR